MADIVCIVCPKGCRLKVDEQTYEVTGFGCQRGIASGQTELQNPTRVVTSTVCIEGAGYPRMPVKTDKDISKKLMTDVMRALDGVQLKAPVKRGDIVIPNVCGTDVNIVATRDL